MLAPVVTPLWPAGHLPHKGGERVGVASYTTTPVLLLDIVSLRSARSCWGERL